MKKVPRWFVGEFFGTFLLVFFGCGSVCAAVATGAQVGVFQVAIVWGLGIATAIYLTGSLSGAHLNPAVTISFSVWGNFPRRRILPYTSAQLLGAFVASVVLYFMFSDAIRLYERANGIVRGFPGSEASAMVFGEYFPNPSGRPLSPTARLRISHLSAFGTEVLGTAVFLLVYMCCTDVRSKSRANPLRAATIGLTATMLISVMAPLTMACLNPARDFGPRLFSCLAGWGRVPFMANGIGWFTVYILAPVLGGVLGGGIYRAFFKPAYLQEKPEELKPLPAEELLR